jgi:hypothetical protein
MAAEWYYLENGQSLGPMSRQDVLHRMLGAWQQPHFVWAEGMTEWVDARRLPEFSSATNATKPTAAFVDERRPAADEGKHHKLAERAKHELIAYLSISGYLMTWFLAVFFYKSTILRSVGVIFAPLGLAAVKALVLGKFILMLEALKLGEDKTGRTIIIVGILKKAVLFTLLLFILSVIEEVVVGYFHGKNAQDALKDFAGGTIPQAIASAVLMFLVLVPYFAFRRLASIFGELPEVLFTLRPAEALERARQRHEGGHGDEAD